MRNEIESKKLWLTSAYFMYYDKSNIKNIVIYIREREYYIFIFFIF